MKTKLTKKSKPTPTIAGGKQVSLEYGAPAAEWVCVSRIFNNWRPVAAPIQLQANGRWTLKLQLPPGSYKYRSVVDGCRSHNPNATKSPTNPFR